MSNTKGSRRVAKAKSTLHKPRNTPFQDATNAMATVLETLGFDLTDENFNGTPERFIKYLQEYNRPYDPKTVLKVDFSAIKHEEGLKGMVVQSNIPFRTICPHHLLPVLGLCHLAYIPSKRLVGISKLTRIVSAAGHEMPRMQETVTDIIADQLMDCLDAKGVIVVVKANHGCMTGRGVAVHDTPTATSTLRGLFRDVPSAKDEFFRLVEMKSSYGA